VALTLGFAAIVGVAAWGFMFALGREDFWRRAAVSGAAVGIYAVAVQPHRIGHLLTPAHPWADVGVGIAGAVFLYTVFWIGEQALVVVLPTLADEVNDLYDLRGSTRRRYMPLVLALAAPGEELFFRGLWQARAGFVVGLAVYGAVHLWERKVILVLAAVLGGAFWGLLLTWTGGLVAPLVSHFLWALAIIVWKPARPAAWARRWSDRLHHRDAVASPQSDAPVA
jgi:membrane protease YdiL (CAAX protease family)